MIVIDQKLGKFKFHALIETGHEHTCLFMNCLWCLHTTRAKLSSCNRVCMASKASNICYLAPCRANLSAEAMRFGIEESKL